MALSKVDMPKRDVFLNYEWIMQVDYFYTYCDTRFSTKEDWYLQSYNAIAPMK